MTIRFDIPASPWSRDGSVHALLTTVFADLRKRMGTSVVVEFIYPGIEPEQPVRFRMQFLLGASRPARKSRRPAMTRKAKE